jgi:adenylate cyclase
MPEQFIAVMFADIAGSSALYKAVGDAAAKAAVFAAINKMSELIRGHDGALVKLIGDEVLCYFSSADLSVLAASNIQKAFQHPLENIAVSTMVSVRIGIHWGPAILDQNDIFGDAVNTAARMVTAAKEKQIVVTPETVNALNSLLKKRCRAFDLVKIKAFAKPVVLYIVSWEENMTSEATYVSTGMVKGQQAKQDETAIAVKFQGEELIVSSKAEIFYMGRDKQIVNLWVNTRFASRRHAWIEFRRGKFVLFDHSTNGTYVKYENDRELFLKREEIPLRGSGYISLGQHVVDNNSHVIVFSCQD